MFFVVVFFSFFVLFYSYCPSLNAFLLLFVFLYSVPSSTVYQRFTLYKLFFFPETFPVMFPCNSANEPLTKDHSSFQTTLA